jgi:hypothetical protein
VQSQIAQTFEPGTYYLGVSGWNGARGNFTVHIESLAVGETAVPFSTWSGSSTVAGNTSGSANGVAPTCAFSYAPDRTHYYLTCPGAQAGNLYFSTCGGASFDTVLQYRDGNSPSGACVDDTYGCGVQSSMWATASYGSGLRAVSVDGYGGASGPYTLAYTLPFEQLHSDNTYTTPQSGYGGGTAQSTTCPPGTVVVGVVSSPDSVAVRSVAPLCATLLRDGATVNPFVVDTVGGSGGTPVTDRCPLGEVVVGIFGHAGSEVDGLGLRCARPYAWQSYANIDVQLIERGRNTGFFGTFSTNCYTGQAVTGFNAQTLATGLTSIQASCTGLY